MCGRFAIAQSLSAILAAFSAQTAMGGFAPQYNAAPQMPLPLLVKNRVGLANWGFPNPVGGRPLFNARSETVHEKTSFAAAFAAGQRCIVPASGFYEWDGGKDPWFVALEGHDLIGFAGLWTRHENNVLFTILTRPAQNAIKPIHERMPVMLAPAQADTWFGASGDQALALCAAPAVAPIQVHRVPKAVGNVRNNGPELMARAENNAQSSLSFLSQ